MITREELIRTGKARGLKPWQEEKRYVQAMILHSFRTRNLVCKGGTYLWFFHGLDRFSEDLDFTTREKTPPDLMESSERTLHLFGLDATHKLMKDDGHTLSFRIDARGPLHTGASDACRVYVEISRREPVLHRPLTVRLDEPTYGIPIDFLKGMDLSEVLAEKVRAFVRRAAVRDLYDMWYLLKRKEIVPDWRLIRQKLSFYHVPFSAHAVETSLEKIRPRWKGEVGSTVLGNLLPFEEVEEQVLARLRPGEYRNSDQM